LKNKCHSKLQKAQNKKTNNDKKCYKSNRHVSISTDWNNDKHAKVVSTDDNDY